MRALFAIRQGGHVYVTSRSSDATWRPRAGRRTPREAWTMGTQG